MLQLLCQHTEKADQAYRVFSAIGLVKSNEALQSSCCTLRAVMVTSQKGVCSKASHIQALPIQASCIEAWHSKT